MGPDLVDDLLQPLLEVAPVPGPGHHAAQVELDQPLALQRVGHVAVDDALGDAFGDRGLPDARLADQHRVVLSPAGQHLDGLLDLLLPADHRVDPALARHHGEVGAELVDGRGIRRRPPAAGPGTARAAGDGVAQRLRGDPVLAQLAARCGLGVDRQREQQVLRPDVGGTEGAGDLPRVEQRPLGRRGEAGHFFPGLAVVGPRLDVPGQRVRVRAGRAQQPADRLLTGRGPQQVIGVEVGIPPPRRLRGGVPDQLAGLVGEQLADVDPLHGPLLGGVPEEAREDVIEMTRAEVVRSERVVGHEELS